MTHRILAIASATLLAVGVAGLAGPAAASDSPASIMQLGVFDLSEVAVDLNTANIDGSYVEVESSDTSMSQPLFGYELRGCDVNTDFRIILFGLSDGIDPANSQFHLTVDDSNYNGTRNPDLFFVSGAEGDLDQNDGAVYLKETSSGNVQGVRWGTPTNCAAGLATAPGKPSASQALHFDGTNWSLAAPGPMSQAG